MPDGGTMPSASDVDDQDDPQPEPVLIWDRWPPYGWELLKDPDDQLRFPRANLGQQGLS
jgi:hypothetical protein